MRFGTRARHVITVLVMSCSIALHSAVARAQPYPGGGQTPPDVGGKTFFPPAKMPRTGFDLLIFLLIALALVAVGAALHVARRAADSDD